MARKFVVKIPGHFRASFPEEEEHQNFTRNFTAFFMAVCTSGFRRKFHGSTSASLAKMKFFSKVFRVLFLLNPSHCVPSGALAGPAPLSLSTLVSTPQSTPISQSIPRSTSWSTWRDFPASTPVPGQGDCNTSAGNNFWEFSGVF